MTALSIIMPCYNRAHDLLRVLQAYDNQTTSASFEIIAVDDASSDRTYELLTGYQPTKYTLRVERLPRNQGPAAARNAAIPLIASPLAAFVGDDIFPDPNFVYWHLQAHKYYPEKETAILGHIQWPNDLPVNTLMSHIDGAGAEQFSYYYMQNGQEYDYRHFYTANISLKRDLLWTLNKWFDTDFYYAAFEDAELSYRLHKLGMRIIYLSSPIAHHYHYHTIWTFSNRQYKAGVMGYLIVRKHLKIAYFFKGKILKMLKYLQQASIHRYSPGVADWIEVEALQLASYYEWVHHKNTRNLYLDILAYFYYKGWIDAIFGERKRAEKIHYAHVQQTLIPTLSWFLENTSPTELPYSKGYQSWLSDKLRSLR